MCKKRQIKNQSGRNNLKIKDTNATLYLITLSKEIKKLMSYILTIEKLWVISRKKFHNLLEYMLKILE